MQRFFFQRNRIIPKQTKLDFNDILASLETVDSQIKRSQIRPNQLAAKNPIQLVTPTSGANGAL